MDFHVDFGGSSVWYHVLRFVDLLALCDQGKSTNDGLIMGVMHEVKFRSFFFCWS